MTRALGKDEYRSRLMEVLGVDSLGGTLEEMRVDGTDLLDLCHKLGVNLSRYTSGGGLTDEGNRFIDFLVYEADMDDMFAKQIREDPLNAIIKLNVDDAYALYRLERVYSERRREVACHK